MNSLRARIVSILVASVFLVVCLATATTFLVLRRSGLENFVRPMVGQLRLLEKVAAGQPPTSPFFSSAPVPGEARPGLQDLIGRALARLGDGRVVVVTRPRDAPDPVASIEVSPGRWLTSPVPEEPPPPETLPILGGWVALILCGTMGISILVARVVTRPLVLLETYAESTSVSGNVDFVPEVGPAEVRATARALNRMSQNLRHAIESRMRLVAAAGHDLRTPMTRMRLRAEFLDDEEKGKWLANLDELERIADSAMMLVKEETSDGGREPVRLDAIVRAVAADLVGIGLPVLVVAVEPAVILGPPLALTRAFRNLVINAATHGGGAELAVGVREGRAVLVVDDRGAGIPEELLDQVFEPFFRADRGRRQLTPGAGLGLAIAREIVSRAGGVLSLRNRNGGGLEQEVSFPLEQVVAEPHARTAHPRTR